MKKMSTSIVLAFCATGALAQSTPTVERAIAYLNIAGERPHRNKVTANYSYESGYLVVDLDNSGYPEWIIKIPLKAVATEESLVTLDREPFGDYVNIKLACSASVDCIVSQAGDSAGMSEQMTGSYRILASPAEASSVTKALEFLKAEAEEEAF